MIYYLLFIYFSSEKGKNAAERSSHVSLCSCSCEHWQEGLSRWCPCARPLSSSCRSSCARSDHMAHVYVLNTLAIYRTMGHTDTSRSGCRCDQSREARAWRWHSWLGTSFSWGGNGFNSRVHWMEHQMNIVHCCCNCRARRANSRHTFSPLIVASAPLPVT